jgi:nucleolar protein 15
MFDPIILQAQLMHCSRVPHGFFEPQMKKYFSQFGNVTRLRLSRNKKTGASKHYAFIEFAHSDVADIVARTMHNYLMFGHILQCRVVPSEQVHLDLFKGANERFKVDPRNRKAGVAMARGAERAVWEKRVEKENVRRASKAKALKDEFDYEYNAPDVMMVDTVPKNALAIEDEAEQQLLIEAPATEVTEVVQVVESNLDQMTVTETVTVKKTKAKKAAKGKPASELDATAGAEEEPIPATKGKTEKKRRSGGVVDPPVGEADALPLPKKAKKVTKATVGEPEAEKKRKTKATDQDGTKPKKAKKAKA